MTPVNERTAVNLAAEVDDDTLRQLDEALAKAGNPKWFYRESSTILFGGPRMIEAK